MGNACAYDSTKGLKTSNSFYFKNTGSNAWALDHTETYGYDAELDWLTSAAYNDGQPGASPTWSYDAAGNRSNTGYAYDNLNRMTAAPSTAYTNDILGNRSTETAGSATTTYTWDVLNRMTGRSNSTVGGVYAYRSDGLRTQKSVTAVATTVDDYRYDGQMPFEDESFTGTSIKATRNVLGARGADAEETLTGTYNASTGVRTLGTATISYPLYDAHGNRISTLRRSGTNGYTFDPVRFYGAWGEIRVGSATGDSAWRYCANLGHVQDDESGLVYMRARYYEPGTGRFICEDPSRIGTNWFVYAKSDPLNNVDRDGKETIGEAFAIALVSAFVTALVSFGVELSWKGSISDFNLLASISGGALAVLKSVIEAVWVADGKVSTDGGEAFFRKFMRKIGAATTYGCALGIISAIQHGDHMGKATAELWYIDNWDQVSV